MKVGAIYCQIIDSIPELNYTSSTMRYLSPFLALAAASLTLSATEFHVALKGNDHNDGSRSRPFRSISAAAQVAQPGDVITVHRGVYRERISPPRGGESDSKRIIYQAAPGEKVEIKGSEVIKGWVKEKGDVWKVVLPNSFFGSFNPYRDLIRGDWFAPKGREHHTGAVYLNDEWLIEAAKLDDLLIPGQTNLPATKPDEGLYLLNVAWLQPGKSATKTERLTAAGLVEQHGVKTAACSEGGECVGWIEDGDWIKYAPFDFGKRADLIELRAASATDGGRIEIRLNGPDGKLLGTCNVAPTGGWQSWSTFRASITPLSGLNTLCLVFKTPKMSALSAPLWFGKVDDSNTTIWAQFKGIDPNAQLVEINVRQAVFYPDHPGRNYLTVRGFILRDAATPWAPPTAEQVGVIGTHWSRGWIIENNVVSHSTCSGIALGKYGDEWDNTSANTAEGYVKTIDRALARGWNRETIGHHIVRNNTVAHCEQAGIVGSLGAAFCTVTGNTIHDIHVRRLFTGAEMAGIKFHAAIDTTIGNNHIYRTCRGLWLDWMAQGTRVSGNLFHDNASEDLFVEVNHGPFLVDNNIFLSPVSLLDMSEGGAYVHNLLAGKIVSRPELSRATPFHPPHTTVVAGLTNINGGDNRFFNNILIGKGELPVDSGTSQTKDPEWSGGFGLWGYQYRAVPIQSGGNVYFYGAMPCATEISPLTLVDQNPNLHLEESHGRWYLSHNWGRSPSQAKTTTITSERLGRARIPQLPYVLPNDSPLWIDTDYFGELRNDANPTPGPFEAAGRNARKLRVR
jgi:alpha-L-arabinofuranosidase